MTIMRHDDHHAHVDAHDDGTAGYHPHESPLVDAGAAGAC
jgi:hypothetical protein